MTTVLRHNALVLPSRGARAVARENGFTLLELLLVLVVATMTFGLVSLQLVHSDSQMVRQDAQRIALLLQLSREEAILRDRSVAFETDASQFHFMVRESGGWQELADDMLHAWSFRQSPVQISVVPARSNGNGDASVLRIVFGREPVDKPFLMTLSEGEASARIRADGLGHFAVEEVK